MKTLAGLIIKLFFNVFNGICPSSLLRAKVLRLLGAKIGKVVKVEKITLMHFEGFNMNNLNLSDRVFIGPGAILDLKGQIIIGESVKIGPGCNISTHVDAGKENIVSKNYPSRQASVRIGKGTWLGAGVTILCGVEIGENVIIGACSLVRSNIPDNCVAYGVPAKVMN